MQIWRPTLLLLVLTTASLVAACPKPDIVPLIGEDPEISTLLGQQRAEDPGSSPLAAARRLHQALMQKDSELAWALLSSATRRALNSRGALIGVSGRELLDASTLPDPAGRATKVRFDEVLFGGPIVELSTGPEGAVNAKRATVHLIAKGGALHERTFVKDDEGWKLEHPSF